MFNTFSAHNFKDLCDTLSARDEGLAMIIKTYGYPPMWTRPNTYETLVHIILEQQVSLASALAALHQLRQETRGITPAAILALSDETMRACYVSRQKMSYIRILARAIAEGDLDLDALTVCADEDIRAQLIRLKGIGHWTIDVYLMFVLQRADIFPFGDLAAVNALKRLKQLPKETPRAALPDMIQHWRPYRTVATMILWHHYLSSPISAKMQSL
ncbi:DNA-3-methyladenine glycosylase 2 family protein [Taibaiella sp. KBW10]|uniref:DNA-3-methyladenine glycosylase family protein n=1 Tax=Taibaiella sp. KBW10 TaxID=2153357 RepID=UPI000F5AC176|nr:DNA-3-methyladenine glycosylase [Taibaiella sp. KBW10]RQO29654.1 DNA-3-methyladenine glycosylase 2 family protein [Taibaiella sp. KBW10]